MRNKMQTVSQLMTFLCGVTVLWKLLVAYFARDYSNLWIPPVFLGLAIASELAGSKSRKRIRPVVSRAS